MKKTLRTRLLSGMTALVLSLLPLPAGVTVTAEDLPDAAAVTVQPPDCAEPASVDPIAIAPEETTVTEAAVTTAFPETTTTTTTTTTTACYMAYAEGDVKTPMEVGETRTFRIYYPDSVPVSVTPIRVKKYSENLSVDWDANSDTVSVTLLSPGDASVILVGNEAVFDTAIDLRSAETTNTAAPETTTTQTTTTTAGYTTASEETTEETQTTTIVYDYAALVEGDTETPMQVGEVRKLRLYKPTDLSEEEQRFTSMRLGSYTANVSVEWKPDSDVIYVTALAPGNVEISANVAPAPFTTYISMTVADDGETHEQAPYLYAAFEETELQVGSAYQLKMSVLDDIVPGETAPEITHIRIDSYSQNTIEVDYEEGTDYLTVYPYAMGNYYIYAWSGLTDRVTVIAGTVEHELIVDYATVVTSTEGPDEGSTPMRIGRTRTYRAYDPAGTTVQKLQFSNVSDNIEIIYESGEKFQVKALASGMAYAEVWTGTTAFSGTINFRILPDREIGDPNGDGIVNAADGADILIEAAQYGASGEHYLTGDALTAADINEDGKADAGDATEVLIYAAYAGTEKNPQRFYYYYVLRRSVPEMGAVVSLHSSGDGIYRALTGKEIGSKLPEYEIFVLTSAEEMQTLAEQAGTEGKFSEYRETPYDLSVDAVQTYDADYFAQNDLIAVVIRDFETDITYTVQGIPSNPNITVNEDGSTASNGVTCLIQLDRNIPEVSGQSIPGYLLLIETTKAIEKMTTVDAVITDVGMRTFKTSSPAIEPTAPQIFGTAAELRAALAEVCAENPRIEAEVQKYEKDAAFFTHHKLAVIPYIASSGSLYFDVTEVIPGVTTVVRYQAAYDGAVMTDDEAFWYTLLPVGMGTETIRLEGKEIIYD